MRFTDQLRRRMEHNLGRFEPRLLANAALAPAAVVIAVTRARECEDACVLLIRRARGMRRHAGQFGLPGGRIDGSETVAQAALRELHEELCLELDEQQVLGALDDYPTRSGFLIRPVVAPYMSVIFQNCSYSTGTRATASAYPDGYAARGGFKGGYFEQPMDFAMEAEAAGAYGENVRDPAEIAPALRRGRDQLRQERPAVIAVRLPRITGQKT